MKVCSRCKINKSLSAFHSNPRYRLGVTGQCKDCRNEAIRLRSAQIRLLPKPNIPGKRCASCGETKPVTAFDRSADKLDGYKSHCKECRKAGEHHRRMTPDRLLKTRLNKYGMRPEDLIAMIDAQDGLCGVCLEPFARPFIDHDHVTGAVRGLLCHRCNMWLAPIEQPGFVAKAHAYLDRCAAVPVRFRANRKRDEFMERHKARIQQRRRA